MKRTKKIIGLVLASAALSLAAVGTADAAPPASSTTHDAGVVSARSVGQPAIYSKGLWSIQFTIHNNTDQILTLDDAKTQHSTGHWGSRAATVLYPGHDTVVTGYSDDEFGMSMNVVYTLPNGEYAVAQANDILGNNTSVSDGVGSGWNPADSGGWYIDADTNYAQDQGSNSKGPHMWADAIIENA